MNRFDPDYCPQLHDVRRLGYVPVLSHTAALATRGVVGSTRCYGIFGTGDKVQTTNNTQIGASEDAVLAYNSTLTTGTDNAVTLGGYQAKNTLGSDLSASQAVQNNGGIALGGYGNRNILGGVELGGANTGTITINGAAGVEELAKQFTATLDSVASSQNSTVTQALDKVSSLAESRQTDGISSLGKIALWALGIIAAGILGYSFLSKSK